MATCNDNIAKKTAKGSGYKRQMSEKKESMVHLHPNFKIRGSVKNG